VPNELEPNPPDLIAFVDTLNSHGVEYVMIGGMAALLHGSHRATFDLDVLASGSLENLERLAAALSSLGVDRKLDSADLRGMTTRWDTNAGRVDVLLAARGPDGKMSISYRDVADRHIDMIHDGRSIPVVALSDLIEMKTSVGRPHDLETVNELLGLQPPEPTGVEHLLDQWEARRTASQDAPPAPDLDLGI